MEQRFEREAQTIAARNHPQTAGVGKIEHCLYLETGNSCVDNMPPVSIPCDLFFER